MTGLICLHLIIGLALSALCLHTWANRRAMGRLTEQPPPTGSPYVSVLIPARNEAAKIAVCVRSWLAQAYPHYEVVVYDDDSSDDTGARARAAVESVDRLRVVRGAPLPSGWRGKPHACHALRAAARGDLLVFADVDVTPAPGTLAGTAAAHAALKVGALSAVPLHTSRRPLIRALVAIQNWAALAFVPSWLAAASRRRVFAALNGQFVAIQRDVYDAVGGFAAVRGTLAEDVALARRLAAQGFRAPLLDGTTFLRCEPYRRFSEVWNANTRNLLPIFFDSATLLLFAMGLLGTLYLGPVVLLTVGVAHAGGNALLWVWLPLSEIPLGMLSRRLADARFGYPFWVTLLHPLAVGSLIAMGIGSVARYRLRKVVEWRGRRYRLHDQPT